MRGPQTQLQRQSTGYLPRILDKSFVGVIGDIVDTVKGRLLVGIERAGQKIGVGVPERVRVAHSEFQKTVRVVIGRLRVPDPFPEETGLDRVRAPDLGERITGAGHVLVGVEARRWAAHLKS